MTTVNPFDLLGDDDTGDINQLIAAQKAKEVKELSEFAHAAADKKGPQGLPAKNAGSAKLPSKPLPPSQAVREARSEAPRGGRGGGRYDGRGRGRGGRGFDRDSGDNENSNTLSNGYSAGFKATVDGDTGRTSDRQGYGGYGGNRGGYRGDRRGGFNNNENDSAEGEHPPRRAFERRSGTGRGYENKREGAGLGNWGSPSDHIVTEIEEPVNEVEKIVDTEKQSGEEADETAKNSPVTESEEKKEVPEDKEMTLEEYEKVLEEKRKALQELKSEERKVDLDKEFESMQLLSNKKNDDDGFLKLGSEKDKRKEAFDKPKKSVSINEFLKPAEGDNYYRPGGRGRGGRGRGGRGGGYGGNMNNFEAAPAIQDVGQFPTLGSK